MKTVALFFLSVLIISCSKSDDLDNALMIEGKYKGIYQFKNGVRTDYDTMYAVDYTIIRVEENSASFAAAVNAYDTSGHFRYFATSTLKKTTIVKDGDVRKIFLEKNILLAEVVGDTLIDYIDTLGGFSKAYRLQ